MILDVRTMYVAMAAICFIVAAALFALQTRGFRRDGALQWALGWALQSAFWMLVGLRGIAGNFFSIVVAHTLLAASYSLLYAAVRKFQGRSYNRGILLFPVAAAFIFFWYFSVYADNLLYRVIFISLLAFLQVSAIVRALLRHVRVNEGRSYRLTGFAFLVMALFWLNRLIEGLTLPYGQLSIMHATTFRNASVVAMLGAAVLSSIGFVLMIREQSEEARRRSEERYRSLFSGMTEGFALHEIICDQKDEPCDYRFLEVNPAFERLTGLKRSDLLGKTVKEVMPGTEAYWIETYGKVALTGEPVHFENFASALEKHYEVFAYSPAPRQFAAVFTDITGRKQAEVVVHTTLQRFYTVLSRMYTGLLLVTDESRVEFANQAFCDYFELNDSPVDLVGLMPSEIFAKISKAYLHPEEALARVKEIVDQGRPVRGEEVAMAGGRELLRDFIPIHINGQSCGRLWYHTDITDRKLAEEALRKAHDSLEQRVQERTAQLSQAYEALQREIKERERVEVQLRQAQKMEALGTMAGGIAHDFNNMLAAIIGFTELVAGHAAVGSRDEHHLARVMEASLRGRDLVRQMLTFSRKTEQEKKPLRMSSIVKETVKLIRATTPTTIDIRVKVESESGMVLGDPTQIQQVLMNLCTNAVHAMREKGGFLDVGLSDFSVLPSNGDTRGMKPGLYVKLAIRDTGAGIAPDVMERIFDPFFTTKKPGEGTGLGLSVVHGIVKHSHGHITVESEPGRGSIFRVYFPKISGEIEADASGDDMLPTGAERILFIDDEEALVEMAEDILAELGYDVTSRMSSREALALFRVDPSRFDLVITDQTMPEMTGVDVAREILALRPGTPIIMCTGFSHLVDADKAKAAGIRAFAMKPLTKGEVARTIRKVLDG